MKKILIALMALTSFSAFAAKGNKSLSGCGAGWDIAPKMSMISMTTRGYTNSVTSPFGTTTGTSGCKRHSIVFEREQQLHLMDFSFDEILANISEGRGEYLRALTKTMGCSDRGYSPIAKHLQEKLGKQDKVIANPVELYQFIHGSLQGTKVYQKSCQPLS